MQALIIQEASLVLPHVNLTLQTHGNLPDRAPHQTYSEDGRPTEPLFHPTDDSPSESERPTLINILINIHITWDLRDVNNKQQW